MTDRIHVTMTVDLFVEDENAMRESAYTRMREAWTSDDDFPFDSAADVPLGQVVHSLLADALPADLPGCRRSQLDVEAEASDTEGEHHSETHDDDTDDDTDSDRDRASDDSAAETHDSSDEKDDKTDNKSDGDPEDINRDGASNDTDEHKSVDDDSKQ